MYIDKKKPKNFAWNFSLKRYTNMKKLMYNFKCIKKKKSSGLTEIFKKKIKKWENQKLLQTVEVWVDQEHIFY